MHTHWMWNTEKKCSGKKSHLKKFRSCINWKFNKSALKSLNVSSSANNERSRWEKNQEKRDETKHQTTELFSILLMIFRVEMFEQTCDVGRKTFRLRRHIADYSRKLPAEVLRLLQIANSDSDWLTCIFNVGSKKFFSTQLEEFYSFLFRKTTTRDAKEKAEKILYKSYKA